MCCNRKIGKGLKHRVEVYCCAVFEGRNDHRAEFCLGYLRYFTLDQSWEQAQLAVTTQLSMILCFQYLTLDLTNWCLTKFVLAAEGMLHCKSV